MKMGPLFKSTRDGIWGIQLQERSKGHEVRLQVASKRREHKEMDSVPESLEKSLLLSTPRFYSSEMYILQLSSSKTNVCKVKAIKVTV